jgi:ABC-type multidrug transport system ATPase subunit
MNVRNVSRSYDSGRNYSIKNISFGIKKKECLGLIGPNGAGKSTILKILSRRTKVFKGHMECDKKLIISFCPQTNILDPNLTVDEMIKFYATLRNIKNVEETKQRVLEKFLLQPYQHFLVKNLSGGNKRKLNVACATIARSGLVMLDEPTSDMDPITRQMIYKSIYELQNDGCSVVLTSHSIAEIEHLCSNVVILTSGTLKTAGSVQELRRRYGKQYVVGMFGNVTDDIELENVRNDNFVYLKLN